MTEFLFPDNTVLCNFAAVERLDLLKSVLAGRGRWVEAVAFEAGRSARIHPCLRSVLDSGWLDDPIEVVEESDIRAIERIRRAVFGGTDRLPLQHLGEAQTCHVILNWSEFSGSWWISDDGEALRYARFREITTRETIDLVEIAVAYGDIEAGEAYELMLAMRDAGRHLRLPRSAADLCR